MMCTAARHRSGFTLIEICIALFLTLALFTLAAGIVKMGVKDARLLRLRDETGLFVLQTRALAMESGRPREIIVGAVQWQMTGPEEGTNPEEDAAERVLGIPEGIKCEVQVWPDDRWIVPEKGVSWLFQPNGICMPLSFRFTEGASFVSFRIHPLTGAIDQESRVIEGDARP